MTRMSSRMKSINGTSPGSFLDNIIQHYNLIIIIIICNHTVVYRCRQYREQLKDKEQTAMTELEKLEQENARLTMKEEIMREKLTRAKEVYLDLIVKGRVRFIK